MPPWHTADEKSKPMKLWSHVGLPLQLTGPVTITTHRNRELEVGQVAFIIKYLAGYPLSFVEVHSVRQAARQRSPSLGYNGSAEKLHRSTMQVIVQASRENTLDTAGQPRPPRREPEPILSQMNRLFRRSRLMERNS
jgi:hypothetical protein